MITGVANSSEGRIRITVRGSRGREQEVEAIVDTGYTASLTLPPALIAALGLRWQTLDTALLADGSEIATVQNGLGNEEAIAKYVERVIRGTTFPAGKLIGPGHVQ